MIRCAPLLRYLAVSKVGRVFFFFLLVLPTTWYLLVSGAGRGIQNTWVAPERAQLLLASVASLADVVLGTQPTPGSAGDCPSCLAVGKKKWAGRAHCPAQLPMGEHRTPVQRDKTTTSTTTTAAAAAAPAPALAAPAAAAARQPWRGTECRTHRDGPPRV